MNTKGTPYLLKPELVRAFADAGPGLYSSSDGIYLTSVSTAGVSCWKLRDTSTDLNEAKSWEFEKGTKILIFAYASGRTIRFLRDQRLDTPTGASNTESPTVYESSQKNGSKSLWEEEWNCFVDQMEAGTEAGCSAKDPINPSHYQNSDGVDIITFTESVGFNRGNAIKYLYRAGKKDPSKLMEDLNKALWYVQREIDRRMSAKDFAP